jgi:hypothetical protein
MRICDRCKPDKLEEAVYKLLIRVQTSNVTRFEYDLCSKCGLGIVKAINPDFTLGSGRKPSRELMRSLDFEIADVTDDEVASANNHNLQL